MRNFFYQKQNISDIFSDIEQSIRPIVLSILACEELHPSVEDKNLCIINCLFQCKELLDKNPSIMGDFYNEYDDFKSDNLGYGFSDLVKLPEKDNDRLSHLSLIVLFVLFVYCKNKYPVHMKRICTYLLESYNSLIKIQTSDILKSSDDLMNLGFICGFKSQLAKQPELIEFLKADISDI